MKPWPVCQTCFASLTGAAGDPLIGGEPETCARCGSETRAALYVYGDAPPAAFRAINYVSAYPPEVRAARVATREGPRLPARARGVPVVVPGVPQAEQTHPIASEGSGDPGDAMTDEERERALARWLFGVG